MRSLKSKRRFYLSVSGERRRCQPNSHSWLNEKIFSDSSRYQSTNGSNAVASTDFTYDSANRLSGIVHKQGTTNLNTYSYMYDPLSRLTSVTSTAEGATNYSYNVTSQLVGATNTGVANETYGYDANGNRNTSGYTEGSDNRTTTDATYSYGYDSEGNITSRTNSTTLKYSLFTWDHRNRLVKVVNNEGTQLVQVDYKYDAFNRLIWSLTSVGSQGGMQQYWYYDEGINPLIHRDSDARMD